MKSDIKDANPRTHIDFRLTGEDFVTCDTPFDGLSLSAFLWTVKSRNGKLFLTLVAMRFLFSHFVTSTSGHFYVNQSKPSGREFRVDLFHVSTETAFFLTLILHAC